VFVRPTLEEVTAYCRERNNRVDPAKWLDHYTSNGWKVGKNAMRDWQAAVRTWERQEGFNAPAGSASQPPARKRDTLDFLAEMEAEDRAREAAEESQP